jgi:WD40 repeat protein
MNSISFHATMETHDTLKSASQTYRSTAFKWAVIGGIAILIVFAGIAMYCALALGSCEHVFRGHSGYVCVVAFSHSGKQIFSGSEDGTVKAWDVESRQCRFTIDAHTGWVQCMSLSPDGHRIVSGGRDDLIKMWDVESGKQLRVFAGHKDIIRSVAYSPDGKLIASSSNDHTIKIWNAESGEVIDDFTLDWVFSCSVVVFAPDNKHLLVGCYPIQLVDLKTGSFVKTFDGHSDSVGSLTYSKNGKWIASAGESQDKTIRLWDAGTGKCLWTYELSPGNGSHCVVFAPKEDVVVCGCFDGKIRFLDRKSGKCFRTTPAHSDSVASLSFNPNGHYLASGSWDRCIKLWNFVPGTDTQP